MNKMLATLAFALCGIANAGTLPTSTPVYACHLKAALADSNPGGVIARTFTASGTGMISCMDWHGSVVSKLPVSVTINGASAGLEVFGSISGIEAWTGKAGISTPHGMVGTYSVQGGPGIAVGDRIGFDVGVETTAGNSVAAKVGVTLFSNAGVGIDVTGYTMVIRPIGHVHHKRHKMH